MPLPGASDRNGVACNASQPKQIASSASGSEFKRPATNLSSSSRYLFPDGAGTHADLLYGVTQLTFGTIELSAPVPNFPCFMDIHAAEIGWATFIEIVGHVRSFALSLARVAPLLRPRYKMLQGFWFEFPNNTFEPSEQS
ncbi:MAG: hypothetical protein NVS3B5_05910 [Sphingomicrobium sp.]